MLICSLGVVQDKVIYFMYIIWHIIKISRQKSFTVLISMLI